MIYIDLKIADDEFMLMEKVVLVYIETLQKVANNYNDLLIDVSEYALDVPIVKERLCSLIEAMIGIIEEMEILRKHIEGTASSFVLTIDQKDDFLY